MLRMAAGRTGRRGREAVAHMIKVFGRERQKQAVWRFKQFSHALHNPYERSCEYAEDHVSTRKYLEEQLLSRCDANVPWLPFSFLGLKVQSRTIEQVGRSGRCRHNSTAAVEASEPTATDGIIITDNCIRRLKEIQMEDGVAGPKKMLRLSVDGGGCSGFLYNFSLDEKQNSDDRLFEKDGVTVVIDDLSLDFVKGATVDFSEELIRASFTVASNPRAASGCGCGASFTAK